MATTNNNNLSASVPIFTGSDLWVWEQKMGDYLKSQHLWRITTGAPGSTWPVEVTANTPTQAEAAAQADWDENSKQVQGIIGSRIYQMLCPHIGMTCTQTWTNLRTRFSTPGVSEITADMYAAYLMKLSVTHNPHPDMERMNMLFKQLNTNSMAFSDTQRGLILLNMIPKEWATVAQIYSQSNWTLATTTFLGVRDAIMAEYEHTSCPSTITMHKISAVKRKGKSPTYTKQTHSKSAPLLEHIVMPTSAEQAEFDARQKAKRKTCWGKKAKKDSVHLAPLDPSLKRKNVTVFGDNKIPKEDIVSNPIDAESRETLFIPDS